MSNLFGGSWEQLLFTTVLPVLLVALSASFHEFAHGYVAYRCGDPTAKEQGRLTLNPLAHIDPFGSIVLPLLMSLSGMGAVFAFAKPVPVNYSRLRRGDRDAVLVALAGPGANLVQALIGAVLFRIYMGALRSGANLPFELAFVISMYVLINLNLMFFNLIPLPPLDGSKVIGPLLPREARAAYLRFQPYAIFVLLVVLYLLPRLVGFDVLGVYLNATAGRLYDLLLGL
jgi:Zn-dependent protease